MEIEFIYQCLDKIVNASEAREGYRDDVLRVCDHCGERTPASESYVLTPIDFTGWTPAMFKAFGPNRCGECLPANAISGEEYIKTPRTGWHHFTEVIKN